MIHYQRVRLDLTPSDRTIKLAIAKFLKNGHSLSHSRFGVLLVGILNYCEQNDIPYELTAYPRQGYAVKRLEPLLLPVKERSHK